MVLFLMGAVATSGAWGIYKKERESRALRDEAEAQVTELRRRESDMRGDIERLKTSRGVEETLRKQYDLAKPGEGLIIIVEPQESPLPAQNPPSGWLSRTFPWW